MKKLLCLLLALCLLSACLPAWGEEDDGLLELEDGFSDLDAGDWDDDGGLADLPDYDYGVLRVGNPTALKGDFFTDMWGNATSDLDVRALIHGYDLILWDGENGMFAINPTVVSGLVVTANAAGDRTYHINLYSDLYFSDGTPITAADYVFTLLLSIDPIVEELGGKPLRKEHIWGYEEYISGERDTLAGVRLINDQRLDITVRHEFLPFFYELGLLDCMPYPTSLIAPGCQVKDEGKGVFMEGDFTADLLRRTILDPETGYRTHPAVSCGPYVLVSFDGVTAEFDINPWFKGDIDGVLPTIPHIQFTLSENDTMMAELSAGHFGLLNKVTKSDTVQQGTQLVAGGGYAMTNYPRTGLTFISFNCEKPAMASQAVRQAITRCTDKDQLVADYVGNFGLRVEGFYGLGQWMYQLLAGTVPIPEPQEGQDAAQLQQAFEAEIARWEELVQRIRADYALSTQTAARQLEQDGWTLNREGQPFRPGTDDVRCKELDGQLVALDLTLAYPAGNRMAESMEQHLVPALREAGIALSLQPVDMQTLLDMFYQRVERPADMLYLGTDFDVVFDPSTHFVAAEDGALTWNYTGAMDEELYRLAVEMRKTEPGDVLTYCQRWIDFQARFAELAPMIPIYSNVYFDFYPRVLHNYILTENVTWTQAIVKAYMGDMSDPEEEETEDEEALGEGEAFFDD